MSNQPTNMNAQDYDDDENDMAENAPETVYIRVLKRAELVNPPSDAPETMYALHDAAGRPLGLFTDRSAAYWTARANNFEAVSAH